MIFRATTLQIRNVKPVLMNAGARGQDSKRNFYLMTEKELEVNNQDEALEPSEVNEVPEAVEASNPSEELTPETITAEEPAEELCRRPLRLDRLDGAAAQDAGEEVAGSKPQLRWQ